MVVDVVVSVYLVFLFLLCCEEGYKSLDLEENKMTYGLNYFDIYLCCYFAGDLF